MRRVSRRASEKSGATSRCCDGGGLRGRKEAQDKKQYRKEREEARGTFCGGGGGESSPDKETFVQSIVRSCQAFSAIGGARFG
jgi:hypothetical protein